MKESRRCVFSGLEHLVQAHINSNGTHTLVVSFVCINDTTNKLQLIINTVALHQGL